MGQQTIDQVIRSADTSSLLSSAPSSRPSCCPSHSACGRAAKLERSCQIALRTLGAVHFRGRQVLAKLTPCAPPPAGQGVGGPEEEVQRFFPDSGSAIAMRVGMTKHFVSAE